MKVITLTQPWATLVAIGAKTIETRSWDTKYRGPLAIHAAKGFPGWAKDLCGQPPFIFSLLRIPGFEDYLGGAEWRALPTSQILCTCDLADVQATGGFWDWEPAEGTDERAFGDYAPGRFMWRLDNVKPLATPIPARGALGLWTFEAEGSIL